MVMEGAITSSAFVRPVGVEKSARNSTCGLEEGPKPCPELKEEEGEKGREECTTSLFFHNFYNNFSQFLTICQLVGTRREDSYRMCGMWDVWGCSSADKFFYNGEDLGPKLVPDFDQVYYVFMSIWVSYKYC